jgi:hypothetical protein
VSDPGPNFSSVSPYTSPNAPPLDTSGSSSGSIPQGSEVPGLAMAWVEAPPVVSSGPGSGSSSSSGSVPTVGDISVDLGSLQAVQNTLLNSAFTIVQQYENLASLFEDYKDWVYGQTATNTQEQWNGGMYSTSGYNTSVTPSVIQQSAQSFAGTPGSPGINDQQAYLLQSIGNAMALVGEFIAVLNAAEGAYASADTNSAMPPIIVSPVQEDEEDSGSWQTSLSGQRSGMRTCNSSRMRSRR